MLFNSYEYIFFFLPIVFLVFLLLRKMDRVTTSKIWLVLASLFFYSWWNPIYLPILVGSMLCNYKIGSMVNQAEGKRRKHLLWLGIIFNVGLLGFFKYYDFFIGNINFLFDGSIPFLYLALPLAISFFTFQQIAFLVDTYRGETKEYRFLNYALFVTFFPQLIAGPIVHHKEMVPQYEQMTVKRIKLRNITLGISLFIIGLFKKVVVADSFAVWANKGFDEATSLNFFEAWFTSLSYTFQLYFDFSAYTDMAIGAALLFQIRLPLNFFSPYKALSIQEFWRRWHITLGRFLLKYIYIPLGGNRKGTITAYVNLLIVFLISGLWHGAGWTFIFWGFLHGMAMLVHRFWKSMKWSMNPFFAWLITFQFVNVTWVFFRANEWQDAIKVLQGMVGMNGISFYRDMAFSKGLLFTLLAALIFVATSKNSIQWVRGMKLNWRYALILAILLIYTLMHMDQMTEFLYFNF